MPTLTERKETLRRVPTEAQQARRAAGLDAGAVACRVGIGVRHLQAIERRGCDCYITAVRLARVVGCPVEFYLHPKPINSKPSNLTPSIEGGTTGTAQKHKKAAR